MRRLDFEVVAGAMVDSISNASSESEYRQWRACCESLANAFEKQSASFERARFLHNCGHSKAPPPRV